MLPTSTDTQDVWPDEPYKGLQYYSAADQRLFSGRDADIEICVHRLTSPETRILLLHGYTGCGKSSFLRAGLIPSIERFGPGYCFLRDAGGAPLFIRSGQDPLARIAEEIFRLASAPVVVRASSKAVDIADLVASYADVDAFVAECRRPLVLAEVLQAISRRVPATLVIVLDQAEEVITLDSGDHARKRHFFRFIREFHAANFPIKLVIALRSEYSGLFVELGQDDGGVDLRSDVPGALWQAGGTPNQGIVRSDIKLFLLRELDREEVRDAILLPTSTDEEHGNPFAQYRFTYADDVLDEIVGDLFKAGTTAALPAMQLTCRDLYRHLPPDRRITRAQYIARGRITGPINRHITRSLKRAFGALRPADVKAEERRWREVLCSLVQGESGGAVRTRIVGMDELKYVAGKRGVVTDVDAMVARLVEPDVLLLRSVPSGSASKGGAALSLGHDFIGLVLHQWQVEEAATEVARRKISKTRRRALWACAGAFAFFGTVAAVFGYAQVRGAAREKYEVLVNNAQSRERTDYAAAMLSAALAIGVADGRRYWISDAEARTVLAKVLAGRPELAEPDRLKGGAAAESAPARTRFFPLQKSGGFVQIRGDDVWVRGKQYRLPSNGKGEASLWVSNDYAICETERGTVLILVTTLAPSRDGNGGQQQTLYVVSDATTENLVSPYDRAYFLGLAKWPGTEPDATGDGNAFLGLAGGRVTLSMMRTHGEAHSLWLRLFAFDEKNAFSAIGPGLDRLPVTFEKSAGVAGSLVLGDYAIVSEPSTGDAPNLVRHALIPSKEPDAATARTAIPLPPGRDWQIAGSADTAAGPLLFLGVPSAAARYSESWAPRSGNFSEVLIVDVATLRTRSVGTAKIQEVGRRCDAPAAAAPAPSDPAGEADADPISFGAKGDAPLAVIGNGRSADLVSLAGDEPACLGRLHFLGRIDRWIVSRDEKFLLGTEGGEGFGWDLSRTMRERAEQLAAAPDLVDRACRSTLAAMIRDPANGDLARIAGVRTLPPALTSELCAGSAASDAHVSR